MREKCGVVGGKKNVFFGRNPGILWGILVENDWTNGVFPVVKRCFCMGIEC